MPLREIEHVVQTSEAQKERPFTRCLLPFDVEVHQLDDGRRIVLDTHRLLIPDVPWIDWMRTHGDSAPHIWLVLQSGQVAQGTLQCERSHDIVRDTCGSDFIACIREWLCSQSTITGMPLPKQMSDLLVENFTHVHDAGSTVCTISLGAWRATAIVACPIWFWGKTPELTCLLPPEAAGRLRARDKLGGVVPDDVLARRRIGVQRVRESV